jgi:ribosomal protein L18E
MGELTKKVEIEAVAISAQAQEKLKKNNISFKILSA